MRLRLVKLVWLAVFAAGLRGAARGQGGPATTVVEPPTPLLPTTAVLVAEGDRGAAPADGAELAAVLKEDGLARTEGRVTLVAAGAKGAASGWVKAYQFGDATGAFAAYTYLRMGGRGLPGGARVNGTDTQTAAGERVFLSGTSVVRAAVRQYPESVDGLLKKIEIGLPKVGGRRGLAPLLPTLVPKQGVESGSVRYAIGPVGYAAMGGLLPGGELGWDKSLEVATATTAGGKGTLTLLLYPTPQIAGERGRAIEKVVNEGAGRFGTVKLRRVGPLVGMASGGLTAGQAEVLVQGLHLNEEVSFDKKMPLEFHAEVRKTASLLQNIAVLCGVLILAAALLGLFLGGARAGIRVMQGKPAASEPEFLTINLRDPPKALLAERDRGPGR